MYACVFGLSRRVLDRLEWAHGFPSPPPRGTATRAKNAKFKGQFTMGAPDHCFSRHGELRKLVSKSKKNKKTRLKHVCHAWPSTAHHVIPRPNVPAKLFALHHALLRRIGFVNTRAAAKKSLSIIVTKTKITITVIIIIKQTCSRWCYCGGRALANNRAGPKIRVYWVMSNCERGDCI